MVVPGQRNGSANSGRMSKDFTVRPDSAPQGRVKLFDSYHNPVMAQGMHRYPVTAKTFGNAKRFTKIETNGSTTMRRSRRRLIDAGLIILGYLFTIVVIWTALLCGATSLELATCVCAWLMLSLPLAVLIGHCALGEE